MKRYHLRIWESMGTEIINLSFATLRDCLLAADAFKDDFIRTGFEDLYLGIYDWGPSMSSKSQDLFFMKIY